MPKALLYPSSNFLSNGGTIRLGGTIRFGGIRRLPHFEWTFVQGQARLFATWIQGLHRMILEIGSQKKNDSHGTSCEILFSQRTELRISVFQRTCQHKNVLKLTVENVRQVTLEPITNSPNSSAFFSGVGLRGRPYLASDRRGFAVVSYQTL